ncbi:MAG: outer membrane protein [Bauldia sp.]
MKFAIAATAITVLSVSGAHAADLSYGTPNAQLYSPVSAVNWTGPHIGINIGAGSGNVSGSYSGTLFGGSVDGQPVVPFGTSGVIGGVQLGYDIQSGPWVFGIEGDIDASGITGSGRQFSGSTNVDASSRLNWLGTFRGRLGYAFDQWLLYVTGGLAVANNTVTVVATGTSPGNASSTQTHTGWTLGVGGEYSLSQHWSIGAEYRYLDLGTKTYTDPVNLPGGSAAVHLTDNVFLAKINYHW